MPIRVLRRRLGLKPACRVAHCPTIALHSAMVGRGCLTGRAMTNTLPRMLLRRDPSYFRVFICGLISLWMFFACLEFAESLEVLTEVVSDGQDLDEQALLQLTFGLKPDILNDGSIGGNSASVALPTGPHAELPVS